jgi:DNA-binding GntR family transcriptional regulator
LSPDVRRIPPSLGDAHLPLRDVVATEMRRMILDGVVRPGERLIEDRIAEQLGVSRNPVREAIRMLESEGFIEVVSRRGAFVASMSTSEAADLFEVRLALEPLGARLAARTAGATAAPGLGRILELAREATAAHDLDALSDLNTDFHATVFTLSDNAYLAAIAKPMVKRAQWLFRHSASVRAPHSWREHQGLLEAIVAGDEDMAESEARRHVLAARASFLRSSVAAG